VHERHRQDRQDRQTDRQRTDSIGCIVLQTVAQKYFCSRGCAPYPAKELTAY